MSPDQLRQAYLDFFSQQGHQVLPSAPIIPMDDPTTLFTSSGMQPLVPYLLGQPHPAGNRLVDSQQCFRSQDIDEVGDKSHTTFFEMLGNWSLGEYFKQQQLPWIFTFLTKICGLEPSRIYVTVYQGDDQLSIPRDEEAISIWQTLFKQLDVDHRVVDDSETQGLQGGRIFTYGDKKNWWSRAGAPALMPVGEPGGPCSELFFDFGEDHGFHQQSKWADQACHVNCDCGRFVEIGNNVFMMYQKTTDGMTELQQKNIDFGGGLERVLAAIADQPDMFKTLSLRNYIEYLEKTSGHTYGAAPELIKSFRIVADHVRAAVMLAAAGVTPSNKEQGYLLRRLLRRAIRHARKLGIESAFLEAMAHLVAEAYQHAYPELRQQAGVIATSFAKEEQKFSRALAKGLHQFHKDVGDELTAEKAFRLFESYGFPLEMSVEEAEQLGIAVDTDIADKYQQYRQQHAQQSRQASAGKFSGGLQDHAETTVKYHTATHLLQAALRSVLGDHVQQQGSNLTAERLRFDFSHPQAMSSEEIDQVQQQMNDWIAQDLPVTQTTMDRDEALAAGALAFFKETYPDQVSVYTVGRDPETDWVSKELCGGPHVEQTGEIGRIEIFKEQSVGAGVRRVYLRLVT